MERSQAQALDAQDELAKYRNQFVITDPNTCYLDGNSLGRLPHATVKAISDFLTQEWGPKVVTGWEDWIDEAQRVGDLIGRSALGAGAGQVLACDTTSVNLYQLALAAIKARPGRKTIIIDAANFPTDRYIMQGIAKSLGLKLITIDNEDGAISENELITPELLKTYLSDDVALVSLQVVQYRSGARQDIKALTELVKSYGALMLWDAAHAVGSVVLDFDKNGVDLQLDVHINMETQALALLLGYMFQKIFKESYKFQYKDGLPNAINLLWVIILKRLRGLEVFK